MNQQAKPQEVRTDTLPTADEAGQVKRRLDELLVKQAQYLILELARVDRMKRGKR